MRIIGKILDHGTDPSNRYKGPYPIHHVDLSEIDESEAYGVYSYGNAHSELLKFLKGESSILFNPILHLPFTSPHYLCKFVVSHHSSPWGIKDFNVTFFTSDGKKTTKEYQMAELPPNQLFWQEFPICVHNVISCDIRILSSWDGKCDNIHLFGIRFVIDKEQEEKEEIRAKEKAEKQLIEFKKEISNLRSALAGEKLLRIVDKTEFKREKERLERDIRSMRLQIDLLSKALTSPPEDLK
ncbi:hypothetical protein ADUPG1_006833 [Aduncisulcus paluster]|uniref:Uncharacterized protein n=1 Tax=Aduncisulcus paluster TaxID=2918883 RepID=A0ABQ5KML0_9EUKA|nr:hypothetical protein ADUPG1_006833 [Aduncisulcus paluster]|eukprot:gnl/Carplike_NY0171/1836_a2496_922.p1 GENE.gnl/Carplike_NY0171/1836_a2496_922~~gnl/Carplike_NY0171/1836_a2496_922.p1  ORF type:complete len:240 (-),score=38.93 gnl/Carplike_NY0171/1836_a2496_922:45-764(-)